MAEVMQILMDKERLQPLADSIKTLKGSDADITLVGMEDTVENANASIENQADLIAQISDALENKAAGGGVSVETCTVTIKPVGNAVGYVSYTTVDETGKIISLMHGSVNPTGAEFVCVCGTMVIFTAYMYISSALENAELLFKVGDCIAVKLTAGAGDTVSIKPTMDMGT